MNDTASTPHRPARDCWGGLRYLYRIPLLLLMFLIGLFIGAFIVGPRRDAVAVGGREPFPHRATRWWGRSVLRVCGLRVRSFGHGVPDPALFVCNHVSWLDIVLMHTQRAVCFVAKDEIAHWPLVGWMAACAGTIFHHRGSTSSLTVVMQRMVQRLRSGRSVAVFPEGGTSRTGQLRVFHARIFQAALDAEVPVQPVALRYMRGGQRWLDVSFREHESFVANIFRVLGAPASVAEVHFLPVVPPSPDGRRHMADHARAEIAAALDTPDGQG